MKENAMIFDHIKNKENYRHFPKLYRALNLLSELEEGCLPEKGGVLIPEELFYNPVSFYSKPEDECKFEAHRVYCDLHYIIKGCERISTADVSTLNTDTPYSEDRDIAFFTGESDGSYNLKLGQFMVCFPNDAHKVAMMVSEPEKIEKIVFKIKAE